MTLYFFLFFTSLVLICYTWIIFPIFIYLLSNIRKNYIVHKKKPDYLSISIIVSAYNEEKNIRKKIENLFELDYPRDKLEIIVASDGSTDNTVSIVSEYKEIKLLDFRENRGKASINNDAAEYSSGEILFFTDSETILSKKFLKNSIKYFYNEEYGCGSGNYTFETSEIFGESENIYWKIEKLMRKAEHILGILPFASGGCMFIRKDIYTPIPPYSDIDNVMPLQTLSQGKKVFYAEDSKAIDKSVTSELEHFNKRVRTTQRSFSDILKFIPILFNKKKFLIIFIIFSHRFLRWSTGLLMLLLLISTLLLTFNTNFNNHFFYYLLYPQLVFYFFGLIGFLQERVRINPTYIGKLFSIIYSFLIANFSFSIAMVKILFGYKIKSWK